MQKGGHGTETGSPWIFWRKGTLHFPALGLRRGQGSGTSSAAPHPPPGPSLQGLCWGMQGTLALAEPPSDKAASWELGALEPERERSLRKPVVDGKTNAPAGVSWPAGASGPRHWLTPERLRSDSSPGRRWNSGGPMCWKISSQGATQSSIPKRRPPCT